MSLISKICLSFSLFKNNLFIYFLLCWVFITLHELSLVAASKGFSLVAVRRLLIVVASLLGGTGSRVYGFQQLQLAGSRAQAQQLWCPSLVAVWHVRSSWTRDGTHVSCIGGQILYQQATREALIQPFFNPE